MSDYDAPSRLVNAERSLTAERSPRETRVRPHGAAFKNLAETRDGHIVADSKDERGTP